MEKMCMVSFGCSCLWRFKVEWQTDTCVCRIDAHGKPLNCCCSLWLEMMKSEMRFQLLCCALLNTVHSAI